MYSRVWRLSFVLCALVCGCVGQSSKTIEVTTITAPSSSGIDACPLSVPAEQLNPVAPIGGASAAITVITGEGCSWTAESQAAFITISPTSGRGSGSVTVTIAANTGASRTGIVIVNQFTVTITQPAVPCQFALSPTGRSYDANGGTGTVSVSVTQGFECQWTATSNSSFIDVTSGSSGTGDGTVAFRVRSNTDEARGGTITIAGLTFTVNQGAVPPPPPPVFNLSIGGYVQPWCSSNFAIRSNIGPGLSSPSAPGPFNTVATQVPIGAVVRLTPTGAGFVSEWDGCDSTDENGACTVTMNGNRAPSAVINETCAQPSFSNVSKMNVAGNWVISYTAVNLLPFTTPIFQATFTASCSGFSVTSQSSSVASGTISGTLSVPAAVCNMGTLTVSDFNGTSSTSW